MLMQQTLRWEPIEWFGLEHVTVREDEDGLRIRSVMIGAREGLEYGLTYDLELQPDWTFRSIFIERTDGATLDLAVEGGEWLIDGGPARQLAGCIDIDISGSPLTNTLPIRRHRLEPGVPQQFRMAWIPLDTLEPFVDAQVYTRLDETHVRYASGDGSFTAVLEVDAQGFVLDYPTLFRRL